MERGWVKLWRKTIESQVFKNEGLLKVWLWCLLKASSKERFATIKVGRSITEVKIYPGQFLFGRHKASQELKMNPSSVWKRMQKLKNIGNIDIKSDSNYSIISLMNWDTYQPILNSKEQQWGQAGDRQVTGRGQAGDTDKNSKEGIDSEESKEIKEYPAESLQPPTIDEIHYAAEPKIREYLKQVCDDLYYGKIFTKAHIFVNTMLKQKKNPNAILYTMTQCLTKGKISPFQNNNQPWGYCIQILKVQDGNFNESEFRKSN